MEEISCAPVLPWIQTGWVGVEIGVAQGWSSELFLKHGVRFMYLIDPWWGGDGDYVAFIRKMTPYQDRYATFRMPSAEAERFMPMVDFVFVDGDHRYEWVSSDLAFYWPKVRAGGVLCGHDYVNTGDCQVARAVDEFAADRMKKVELALPCWVIRKEP